MPTVISHFEAPEDYAAHLAAIPSQYKREQRQEPSFFGGSVEANITKLVEGDTSNLARVERIIDNMETSNVFSIDVPVLVPSVVGFVPNVPAVLAGHPESMFNRGYVESPSLTSPLTVYVNTSVHADLKAPEIINRGVAVLAFVLAMERVRPVDLYVLNIRGNEYNPGVYGSVVKVASRPMDLGRATYMLTDLGFTRALRTCDVYHKAQRTARDGGPFAFDCQPQSDESEAKFRELLDISPNDVFIRGAHRSDKLMLSDPVAWVNQMIVKHSNHQENV